MKKILIKMAIAVMFMGSRSLTWDTVIFRDNHTYPRSVSRGHILQDKKPSAKIWRNFHVVSDKLLDRHKLIVLWYLVCWCTSYVLSPDFDRLDI